LPVTYAQTYPEINLLSPIDKQIDAFFLTKAKDWYYEEEWRIIDHNRGAGDRVFPAELLVGVILGSRMTGEDKRTITEWVKESVSSVEVLQAFPASRSFSIEIGPCDF
jgi:hypothetical protein